MSDLNPIDILIVEDNPNDVELILRAMKKNNLANKVLVAKDGAEALEVLFGTAADASGGTNANPKVILLDLKLPKVDGMEVLRRIKSEERTKTIPVVALTSSTEERDLAECYKLGVNSYVAKPIKFEEFVQVVAELGLYWLLLNKLPPSSSALKREAIT